MAQVPDRPLIFVKLYSEGVQATKVGKTLKAPTQVALGETLDISDKIISFRYEDEERKSDRMEITLDNWDLAEFDNPAWKKGGILEATWGYPGQMTPPRRCVIQKVSGGRELRIEALGLEMLMHTAKTVKVYKNKTLYDLVKEVSAKYAGVIKAYAAVEQEEKAIAESGGFDKWYAQVAARKGLDTNPDAKKHFYDFRALYRDMVAGKVPMSTDNLPDQYRKGAPSMWVRNEFGGPLVDARTGREITDAEIDKVQSTHAEEGPEEAISPAAKRVKLGHLAQSAQTDAQLLSKLARKYGYVFYVDQNGVTFKPRDAVYKQRPSKIITWYNGEGEWLDFSYESDTTEKSGKVTEKGIDPLNQKAFEAEASDDKTKRNGLAPRVREFEPKTGNLVVTDRTPKEFTEAQTKAAEGQAKSGGDKSFLSKLSEIFDVSPAGTTNPLDAKAKADGKFKKRQGHKHELSGKLVGDPKFLAKTILQVEGLGRRLSGKWAVKKVDHTIDSSGYVCDFKAERDGDNGYGQKGEVQSKANLNKEEVKKTNEGPQPLRVFDQRTGEFRMTTRDPNGTGR